MRSTDWTIGDWVIYRKQKSSTSPGSRAYDVVPAAKGDNYRYVVEKFWVVEDVLDDGRLRLRTRRGKQHEVPTSDPLLRKARFWERWLYRSRFLAVADADADGHRASPHD